MDIMLNKIPKLHQIRIIFLKDKYLNITLQLIFNNYLVTNYVSLKLTRHDQLGKKKEIRTPLVSGEK